MGWKGVLVREDPLPTTTSGGLVLPQGVIESIFHTGTVLAVGYLNNEVTGERYLIPDLEPGLKCAYVRFLREQHTAVAWREMFDGLYRVEPSDILVVWPATENVVVGGSHL
jgi:hypothetical protein